MTYKYTVVTSFTGALNKSFALDGTKKSNAYLTYGNYKVEEVQSVEELLKRFKTLAANQAIIPSVPKNGKTEGIINSETIGLENAITRTKNSFSFDGKHLICFDYDPDVYGFKITSQQHFTEVLRDVDPELINCKIGVGCGSSYGVYRGDEAVSNKLSFHAYILIENATDERVQAYKESLKNSCWKLGYGHVKISKAGSLLQRQIFDDVVLSPERLLYEALPTLAEGLTQVRPDDYINGDGARDLSNIQLNDGEGTIIFEEAKEFKSAEAKIIRDKYIDEKSDELAKSQNITKEVAVKTITRKVTDSVLTADDVLNSKDGIVKVTDIFLNPQQYRNLQVLDPINPKPNEYVAMVYVNDNNIIVHSFKSGGINYKLVANELIIQELCNKVVCSSTVDNKQFVKDIVVLCDNAEVPQEFRKELSINLKMKKIVSNVKELNTRVMKIPFPDFKYVDGEIRLLNTIDNLSIFLEYMKIDVKYDEILKEGIIRAESDFSGFNKDTDDKINSQFIKIKSEAIKGGLPEKIIQYLPALIDSNSVNPMMEMVKAQPWDGVDRVGEVIACLKSDDIETYVKQIITLWLLQTVAAWDYIKSCPIQGALARFESVLVFVGNQGLSKTKFFEGLLPNDYRKYVKAGVHLDVHNKDSIKIAICSAICEMGELNSSFLKDIGALKAFMSLSTDKFRLPYKESESNFRRRTSFCASVNDVDFLIDPTGNRRFQPICLKEIDYERYMRIDKQQLWAQVYAMYVDGNKWWIDERVDSELYAMLNKKHDEHMMILPIDDIIEKVIADTLGLGAAVVSDPMGILPPKPINNPDFTFNDYVYKTATEITTHFKLPVGKRGNLGKIKKSLLEAGIEQKGNTFKIRLVG